MLFKRKKKIVNSPEIQETVISEEEELVFLKNQENDQSDSSFVIDGSELNEEEYDMYLSKTQADTKNMVQDNHLPPSKQSLINQILALKEYDDVFALLLADNRLNHLVISLHPEHIIEMIENNNFLIDFSFLYLVQEGNAVYYGIDEYTAEITDLFQEICNYLMSGNKDPEEIKLIKGINIFHKIILDL